MHCKHQGVHWAGKISSVRVATSRSVYYVAASLKRDGAVHQGSRSSGIGSSDYSKGEGNDIRKIKMVELKDKKKEVRIIRNLKLNEDCQM